MTEGTRPMKVSDEARKAAWQGQNWLLRGGPRERFSWLAGFHDSHPRVQAFARFEAEVRKDERERVIGLIRTQFDAPHNAKLCGRIMDTLRSLSDDGEGG